MSKQSGKPNKYIDDMAATGSAGETASESGRETASAEAEESPNTSFDKPDANGDANNAGDSSKTIQTRSMTKGPSMRPLTSLMSDMESALPVPKANTTSKQSLSKVQSKGSGPRNLAKRKKMPHWTAQAGPLLTGFFRQREREEQKQAQKQLEAQMASMNQASQQRPNSTSLTAFEEEERYQAESDSAQPNLRIKQRMTRNESEIDSAATSDIESTSTNVASPAQIVSQTNPEHSGSEESSAEIEASSHNKARAPLADRASDRTDVPQSDWSVQAVRPSSEGQIIAESGSKYQPEYTETGTEIAPSREPSSIPPDPTHEPEPLAAAPSVLTNSEVPVNKRKQVKFDLPEQTVQYVVPQEAARPPPVQRGWLAAACSTNPIPVPAPRKPQKSVQTVPSRATPLLPKQTLPHTYAMSSLPFNVGPQQNHPPYNFQQQQQEGWMQGQPMYQNQAVYPQYPTTYAYQYSPPMQAMPYPMYQQQAPQQQMYPGYPHQPQYPGPPGPQYNQHVPSVQEEGILPESRSTNNIDKPRREEDYHVERPSFRSAETSKHKSTKKIRHKHEHRDKDAHLSSPSPPPRESSSRRKRKNDDDLKQREDSEPETGSPRRFASVFREQYPEKHLQAVSSSSRHYKASSPYKSSSSALQRKIQKQEQKRAQRPSHQEMYAYSAKRGRRIPNDLDAFGASEDDSGKDDWNTLHYAGMMKKGIPLHTQSPSVASPAGEEKIIPSVYKKFQPNFTPKMTREALEAEKRRAAEEAASKRTNKSPYGGFDDGQGRKVSAFSDPAFGNSEPLLVGKKKRLSLFRPPSKEEYEAEQRRSQTNEMKRKAGDLVGLDDHQQIDQGVPSSDKENVSEKRGGGAYSFLSQMVPSVSEPKYVSSLYKRSKLDIPASTPAVPSAVESASSPAVGKTPSSDPESQPAPITNSTPPTSPQPATPVSLSKFQARLSPGGKAVIQSPKVYREANESSPIKEHRGEEEEQQREEERVNTKQPSAYSRFFDEPENEEEEEGINNVSSMMDAPSDASSRKWGFW